MKIKKSVFRFNDEITETLNMQMVLALFKILYKQDKVTKKEYDAIVLTAQRTFNFN